MDNNELPYTDHKGNKYATMLDMCKAWGVNKSTYQYRIRSGYSVEDALTLAPNHGRRNHEAQKKEYIDHNGVKYKSLADMCRHWHITVPTYIHRLNSGHSIEYALTHPIIGKNTPRTDHLGNIHNSFKDMCKYWGKKPTVVYARTVQLHWTLERALTTPVKEYDIMS